MCRVVTGRPRRQLLRAPRAHVHVHRAVRAGLCIAQRQVRACSLAAPVVLRLSLNGTSAASVAMFSRRVIARCGPPAGVAYNTSASFRGKTVWRCGLLYAVYGIRSNWDH